MHDEIIFMRRVPHDLTIRQLRLVQRAAADFATVEIAEAHRLDGRTDDQTMNLVFKISGDLGFPRGEAWCAAQVDRAMRALDSRNDG